MNQLFFHDLNLIKNDEDQWSAYQSNSNTVLIAGPGSGKTRVLTLKAIKIIQTELSKTAGLACLSFSNETVRELKKRLTLYGYVKRKQDFIGTVHGFCLAEIISPFQNLFPQYQIPNPLKIAPKSLVSEIYISILAETKFSEKDIPLDIINRERYISILGSSQVNIKRNPLIQSIAEQLEERLLISQHLDFVQITKIATQIIQENDYVTKSLEAKYPWMLIDEYQDLGKALHEMVLALYAKTDMRIYAVGDMDQSIYGFQGAYPEFLEELSSYDDFNSILLKNNYRSNQTMIEASITALNPPPPPREYTAKLRQGELAEFTFIKCNNGMLDQFNCVANKVIPKLQAKGITLDEIAIVTGSNFEAIQLSQILREQNIPCYVVRWEFDTRTEVIHWILDCANWCEGNKIVSFKVISDFWIYLIEIHKDKRRFENKLKLSYDFLDVLNSIKQIVDLKTWLDTFLEILNLETLLLNSERFPDERINLLKLLKEVNLGALKNFSRLRFSSLLRPQNEVTVTTRHSVKGLEFEAVILLGMEEERFPGYYSISDPQRLKEDHRICYVCVSRAKKACILIHSHTHIIPTKYKLWHKPFAPSRFWNALHQKFGNINNTFDELKY